MSIENALHPEVYSGDITQFGFFKIERQTKSVIRDILTNFFSNRFRLYQITVPEIVILQNSGTEAKLYIERDFPFFERNLPLIAVTCKAKEEKKAFLGGDDFLYQDVVTINGVPTTSFFNMYANMYNVNIQLILATTSPDLRSHLAELISLCFTHYYRWPYMYKGEDSSYFNIVPCNSKVQITGEAEIVDKSSSTLLYTCNVLFQSFVEYIFPDIGDGWSVLVTEGFNFMDRRTSTGMEQILVPIYTYSSTGLITSTAYYTSTGYNGNDIRWWATTYGDEIAGQEAAVEEDVRNPIEFDPNEVI